jgi:Fur family ferric uptake transcriptional regulator
MPDTTPWTSALDDAGYFVTEPRRVVAQMLADRDSHFTANELVGEAKRARLGVGRATVFRALELFEQLGLVERLDLPNGEHAYVVCQPAHHHHVICTVCGRSAEVGDPGIGSIAAEVESQTGFTLDSHRIELYGLCSECRTAGADGARRRLRTRPSRTAS